MTLYPDTLPYSKQLDATNNAEIADDLSDDELSDELSAKKEFS